MASLNVQIRIAVGLFIGKNHALRFFGSEAETVGGYPLDNIHQCGIDQLLD